MHALSPPPRAEMWTPCHFIICFTILSHWYGLSAPSIYNFCKWSLGPLGSIMGSDKSFDPLGSEASWKAALITGSMFSEEVVNPQPLFDFLFGDWHLLLSLEVKPVGHLILDLKPKLQARWWWLILIVWRHLGRQTISWGIAPFRLVRTWACQWSIFLIAYCIGGPSPLWAGPCLGSYNWKVAGKVSRVALWSVLQFLLQVPTMTLVMMDCLLQAKQTLFSNKLVSVRIYQWQKISLSFLTFSS